MTETVQTHTHFLQRDSLYATEKPYSLRFTPPTGFPRANIKLEKRGIKIRDIRGSEPSFADDGTCLLDLRSSMLYDDYDDDDKVKKVYLKEVADRLKVFLGAQHVQIFEHTVRKRHDIFPISTGEPYKYNQPTSIAHVDTTLPWALAMARQLNPDRIDGIMKHRVQCVKYVGFLSLARLSGERHSCVIFDLNTILSCCVATMEMARPNSSPGHIRQEMKDICALSYHYTTLYHYFRQPLRRGCQLLMEITGYSFWKPIRGPVKDWPLALCSPRTVKPDRDFEPCDLVYPDYVVENRQVYHSDEYDWFYVSDQQPHEAWVFLQSDTETENKPVVHTSFPINGADPSILPRESIEARALVYYGGFDDK